MDDYAVYLISEQHTQNSLLIEILQSGYEQWDYLVAVEGPDDRIFYYDYLVDYLKTDKIWLISCGGKDALLGLKKSADTYNWTPSPSIIYLCDKDFDDYLSKKVDNVYYTSDYSIENLVASKIYIKYMLSKHAKKQLSISELDLICHEFEEEFARLADRVRSYCAFMCAVRESGEHPLFDDFGIDHLFSFQGGRCDARQRVLRRAAILLGVKKSPSFKRILSWARTFGKADISIVSP